jgi:hypothetical protein
MCDRKRVYSFARQWKNVQNIAWNKTVLEGLTTVKNCL